MEKIKIVEIKEYVRGLIKDIDKLREDQRERIKVHLSNIEALLKKFSDTRKRFFLHNERCREIMKWSEGILDEVMSEIELVIIESGGSVVRMKTRLPRDFSGRLSYVKYLIEYLESLNLKRLERAKERLKEVYSKMEVVEREGADCNSRSINRIRSEIIKEWEIIDQILHPEKTIIVNTRERFD